jgi:hypothetical protein
MALVRNVRSIVASLLVRFEFDLGTGDGEVFLVDVSIAPKDGRILL